MKEMRSLQQKGLNKHALPFKSKMDTLRLLPPDDHVVNPWKYHSYFPEPR